MKVNELRELLEKSDFVRVKKAFVESYKQFPKSCKEEIDQMIVDILAGNDAGKKEAEQKGDYTSLENEIDVFIDNAYSSYYFEPNRVIPKNQRPKWRFHVKRYIKELGAVKEGDSFYEKSGTYLLKLFKLLSESCNFYLFSTEDAFRSIGMEQEDLFQIVAGRIFSSQGYTEVCMKELLWTAASCGLSRECLNSELMAVLISCLKTTDMKYLAIETAKALIKNKKKELAGMKKHSMSEYTCKSGIQELNCAVLCISALLGEMENEASYYFENVAEYDNEIALHMALDVLSVYGSDNDWKIFYEYGTKKLKIKPRKELQEIYKKLPL